MDDTDKKLLEAIRRELARPIPMIPGLERKPYRRGSYEAEQLKRRARR